MTSNALHELYRQKQHLRQTDSQEDGRVAPQTLSDQAAGLSNVSSYIGSAAQRNVKFEVKTPLEHVIHRQASKYGLGKAQLDKDYKPHDHINVEDSPEAKQNNGYFTEQGTQMNKGMKFISTFKEPEPEEIQNFNTGQDS
jgi:hypothetical protein